MAKLLVVIGVTGNQGGSVARRFLQDPSYRIRGLTRNASSPAALALSSLGIEIVSADLDDVDSLKVAFQGANLIFSVTNYWEPFFRPDARAEAEKRGISCRQYAYEVELRQGRNIADAAASPEILAGLDEMGFVASTLSYAKKCSGGKFRELYHFDAKAEVFPRYVEEKYAELARKTSYVQTGYFMSSYRLAPGAYFAKVSLVHLSHCLTFRNPSHSLYVNPVWLQCEICCLLHASFMSSSHMICTRTQISNMPYNTRSHHIAFRWHFPNVLPNRSLLPSPPSGRQRRLG